MRTVTYNIRNILQIQCLIHLECLVPITVVFILFCGSVYSQVQIAMHASIMVLVSPGTTIPHSCAER